MQNADHEDIILRRKKYRVRKNDFPFLSHNFNPLEIRQNLADLDREIAFIHAIPDCKTVCNVGSSYGGYIPLNLDRKVIAVMSDELLEYNMKNVTNNIDICTSSSNITADVLRIDMNCEVQLGTKFSVIISQTFQNPSKFSNYWLFLFLNKYIYVHSDFKSTFEKTFTIKDNIIQFDNLVNLLIMVKNAGDGFREILRKNIPYIDYWTVLDTGSTDNTLKIIREELAGIPGQLFQEPFINFKDSRNRCLDLAGDKYAFNIMLDDTYTLNGRLRDFLSLVRADNFADSFSLFIHSNDLSYSSNRITRPERKLRYEHRVHEIIQSKPNVNAQIPLEIAYITDHQSTYMKERTSDRKMKDLFYLFQDLDDMPNDPRTLYYIGETFLNMDQYKNAYEYYKKRSELSGGFSEEIQDSLYKQAYIAQDFLHKSWDEVFQMYMKCYNYDPKRAESLFMIGKSLLNQKKEKEALSFFKKAMELGIPNSTMNVRMHIYVNHLPRELLPLCFKYDEFTLGKNCATFSQKHNPSDDFSKWIQVYSLLEKCRTPTVVNKKHACFIAFGGWTPWNGETYDTSGIGGSESFVIKFAEYSIKYGYDATIVCQTTQDTVYKGVKYISVDTFLNSNESYSVCFVNRYVEFVPVAVKKNMPTYLILHDLLLGNEVICCNDLFKGILCISNWHKDVVGQVFPRVPIQAISYAIDVETFTETVKEPYSFIYSSFPNRGLLHLLQMFPKITTLFPQAKLHVFCDMKHRWTLEHFQTELAEIEKLLDAQKDHVENHGWVNKNTLYKYWERSQFWFYPCVFRETACLTAFEAAASKTLIITNNLAALNESVGSRGVIIPGDATTDKWQETAVNTVIDMMKNTDKYNYLIEQNYQWAKDHSYDKIVPEFMNKYFEL